MGDRNGIGMDNLRRGMDDLLKKCKGEWFEGELFRETCVYLIEGRS